MEEVKELMNMPDESIDMIAATSVLQQQAGDIRSKTINWASYMQSQMISQEDYQCISALDKSKASYLLQNPAQAVKTLLNLLSHVSKDSTIQYILVMIDDLLQEDRHRVEFFHDYAAKRKECVWGPFLNLLNRQDGFIVNMASRILAKLACWSPERMPKSDLNFYLQFLKDQLTVHILLRQKYNDKSAWETHSLPMHHHHLSLPTEFASPPPSSLGFSLPSTMSLPSPEISVTNTNSPEATTASICSNETATFNMCMPKRTNFPQQTEGTGMQATKTAASSSSSPTTDAALPVTTTTLADGSINSSSSSIFSRPYWPYSSTPSSYDPHRPPTNTFN